MKRIRVEFTQRYHAYNPKEQAVFDEEVAKNLCDARKVAKKIGEVKAQEAKTDPESKQTTKNDK